MIFIKKIIFLIFLSIIFCLNVNALELTNYSKSAILIEPSTNTLIYELNKDERLAPASMTKIMTMLLIMEALDTNKISLNDDVLISKNAADMGGSQVFLEANSKIKVEQLLKGIAIASGNDAAVAMAEYIAGTTDEFVKMMNNKVKTLGLKNTNFMNVHGLDVDNHYSSAYDMAQIAMELIKYEDILNYTSLYEDHLIKPDGSKTWLVNTNKLVRFYEGIDGLKTGYTSNAKYCLTATGKKNNIRFISVVMGVDTSEHRSLDTSNMFNYAFANYKLNNILSHKDILAEIEVKHGMKDRVNIYSKVDVTDLIKQNESKNYSFKMDTYSVTAPIKVGDIVGNLEVVDNNGKVVKIVDLVVKEDVSRHNFGTLFWLNLKNIISGYL